MEHDKLFMSVNDSIRELASEDSTTDIWNFICEMPGGHLPCVGAPHAGRVRRAARSVTAAARQRSLIEKPALQAGSESG
jgi:hypothetical protein